MNTHSQSKRAFPREQEERKSRTSEGLEFDDRRRVQPARRRQTRGVSQEFQTLVKDAEIPTRLAKYISPFKFYNVSIECFFYLCTIFLDIVSKSFVKKYLISEQGERTLAKKKGRVC